MISQQRWSDGNVRAPDDCSFLQHPPLPLLIDCTRCFPICNPLYSFSLTWLPFPKKRRGAAKQSAKTGGGGEGGGEGGGGGGAQPPSLPYLPLLLVQLMHHGKDLQCFYKVLPFYRNLTLAIILEYLNWAGVPKLSPIAYVFN